MKKTILCFMGAALMLAMLGLTLTMLVSAEDFPAEVSYTESPAVALPSRHRFTANEINTFKEMYGLEVCQGTAYATLYNPEDIKQIILSSAGSEGEAFLYCGRDGAVRIEWAGEAETGMYPTKFYGTIYGLAIADTDRKTLEISRGGYSTATGGLGLAERLHEQGLPSETDIIADTITMNFLNRDKVLVRISNDGVISFPENDVFFGCQKQDSEGKEVSCSLTAEIQNRVIDDLYILLLKHFNIEGSGFVSESEGLETYFAAEVKNVEELRQRAARLHPDLVVVPLSEMRRMSLSVRFENVLEDYTSTMKAETTASSSIDSIQIRSDESISIPFLNLKVVDLNIESIGSVYAIDSAGRLLNQRTRYLTIYYGGEAKVSIERSKLVETLHDYSISFAIVVFPEDYEHTYRGVIESMQNMLRTNENVIRILLKPSNNEMRILPEVQSSHTLPPLENIYLLPGFDSVVIDAVTFAGDRVLLVREYEWGFATNVKVTNPKNNAWIKLSNNELAWTPGKSIADLGFNFKATLFNTETSQFETIECNKQGECTLDGTRVTGMITQESLRETRRQRAPRAEESAKAGIECRTDRDCDETQRCLGRICVEEETECLDTRDCERGEVCDRGICMAPEEALGAKSTPEEAAAMEAQCGECGGGALDVCDMEECHMLGACYLEEGSATNIFSDANVFNKCRACAMAASCSTITDSAMCGNEQCTSKAGLSCEWSYGRCVAATTSRQTEDPAVMEAQCGECGGGALDVCDMEECHMLGACYLEEGSATNIFSDANVFNKCRACAMAASCSTITDSAMCGNEQCTSKAGLSCEWRYGRCIPATVPPFSEGAKATEEEALEMEFECESCGDGANNLCDSSECHGLSSCYYKEGSVANIFTAGNVRGSCHACATADSCSAFSSDNAMCVSQQCTSDAGLSCEWRSGACHPATGSTCTRLGGACRDICTGREEESSVLSASQGCFRLPMAGHPPERRVCCIPKEEEYNACESLGGTCREECDTGGWWSIITGGGNERMLARDMVPYPTSVVHEACGAVFAGEEHDRYIYGDVCCVPIELCEDFPCAGWEYPLEKPFSAFH